MRIIIHSYRPHRVAALTGRQASVPSISVVSIGTALGLLAGLPSAQAGEIRIASPGAYVDQNGEGCFCGHSEPPYRYQQVFPAADFAALGNRPHWIVAFGPRADESVTSPHTAHLPDNVIRLSTTGQKPSELGLSFDANHGSDVMEFYRGPLTMVADGAGPREFYQPDFSAGVIPFLYDPRQGNLLFDFTAWQGESPKILVDQIPGMQLSVAQAPHETQGGRGPAAIFQFTFVPAIHSARPQLIINGGFEAPDTPTFVQINPGQDTMAPWVVGGHSVEVGDAIGNGFITGPAFEGAQFLDLNGLQPGRITQSFATTPGSLNTVTFAFTDNYWEPSTSGSASAGVRIFDDLGDRLKQTITHTGAVAGNYHWSVFTAQFTALQNTTRLEFTSLSASASGHGGGIMLDGIQVIEGALEIDSITRLANGSVVLTARGFPNGAHRIQASPDLSAGSFADLGTVTAGADGRFAFHDARPSLSKIYYRIAYP